MTGRGLSWKRGFQRVPGTECFKSSPGRHHVFRKTNTDVMTMTEKELYRIFVARTKNSFCVQHWVRFIYYAAVTDRYDVTGDRTAYSVIVLCESVRFFPPAPFQMDTITNFARCFAISYGVLFPYVFVNTFTRPLDKKKKNAHKFQR